MCHSIGAAKILSEMYFFPLKLDDSFSRRPQKTVKNYKMNHSYLYIFAAQQNCPQIDSCSAWRMYLVCWGCTYRFSL